MLVSIKLWFKNHVLAKYHGLKKRLHKHLKNQNACKSTSFVFQNVHLMFDFAIQGVYVYGTFPRWHFQNNRGTQEKVVSNFGPLYLECPHPWVLPIIKHEGNSYYEPKHINPRKHRRKVLMHIPVESEKYYIDPSHF